jgi:PEP-CTERM motif-containing protein
MAFNGVYTSTIMGSTNTQVPVNWTPNYGFDLEPSFNHVATGNQNSGNYDLSIGNYDYEPIASLSQTLADVSGATYTASFWAYDGGANGDPNAFLAVLVNGTMIVSLDDTVATWTQSIFTFTGTGSDTLTVEAQTNPSEWYADDFVVTGPRSATPEPGSLMLFGTGIMGLAGVLRRKINL